MPNNDHGVEYKPNSWVAAVWYVDACVEDEIPCEDTLVFDAKHIDTTLIAGIVILYKEYNNVVWC